MSIRATRRVTAPASVKARTETGIARARGVARGLEMVDPGGAGLDAPRVRSTVTVGAPGRAGRARAASGVPLAGKFANWDMARAASGGPPRNSTRSGSDEYSTGMPQSQMVALS